MSLMTHLHRHHTPTRPMPAVPVPRVPRVVWIDPEDRVAHASNSAVCACWLAVEGGRFAALTSILYQHYQFCGECFPGQRCEVCGIPSGGHSECAEHLRESISTDKRIERAA